MTAVAESAIRRHRFTVLEYQRLGEAGVFHEDDRIELIEGELIDMAPIGSRHAGAVKRLSNLIKLAVGEQAIISTQDPVVLGDHSEPQPDIALLRPRADFYSSIHPHAQDVWLVIEVADTTLAYDQEIKIPLYARFGIPEIWLVAVTEQRLLRYRFPKDGQYQDIQVIDLTQPVEINALAGVVVDLRGLF
jgi:Uma2 family endonuclease